MGREVKGEEREERRGREGTSRPGLGK